MTYKVYSAEYKMAAITEFQSCQITIRGFAKGKDIIFSIKAEEVTLLEAAVKYFITVNEESKTFLQDRHIPISNNICERAIKPFAIMRRNVLFAKTENGASISGRIFILVQTAKANALVVEKYIEYALENINKVPVDNLLPWPKKLRQDFL